uniref:Uncharacterized protein n=1 Tax=Leersia perrieri TaxID=77586 RepID=A0A0D9WCF8_9ORYZ
MLLRRDQPPAPNQAPPLSMAFPPLLQISCAPMDPPFRRRRLAATRPTSATPGKSRRCRRHQICALPRRFAALLLRWWQGIKHPVIFHLEEIPDYTAAEVDIRNPKSCRPSERRLPVWHLGVLDGEPAPPRLFDTFPHHPPSPRISTYNFWQGRYEEGGDTSTNTDRPRDDHIQQADRRVDRAPADRGNRNRGGEQDRRRDAGRHDGRRGGRNHGARGGDDHPHDRDRGWRRDDRDDYGRDMDCGREPRHACDSDRGRGTDYHREHTRSPRDKDRGDGDRNGRRHHRSPCDAGSGDGGPQHGGGSSPAAALGEALKLPPTASAGGERRFHDADFPPSAAAPGNEASSATTIPLHAVFKRLKDKLKINGDLTVFTMGQLELALANIAISDPVPGTPHTPCRLSPSDTPSPCLSPLLTAAVFSSHCAPDDALPSSITPPTPLAERVALFVDSLRGPLPLVSCVTPGALPASRIRHVVSAPAGIARFRRIPLPPLVPEKEEVAVAQPPADLDVRQLEASRTSSTTIQGGATPAVQGGAIPAALHGAVAHAQAPQAEGMALVVPPAGEPMPSQVDARHHNDDRDDNAAATPLFKCTGARGWARSRWRGCRWNFGRRSTYAARWERCRITDQALADFKALFAKPLPADAIAALDDLFGFSRIDSAATDEALARFLGPSDFAASSELSVCHD